MKPVASGKLQINKSKFYDQRSSEAYGSSWNFSLKNQRKSFEKRIGNLEKDYKRNGAHIRNRRYEQGNYSFKISQYNEELNSPTVTPPRPPQRFAWYKPMKGPGFHSNLSQHGQNTSIRSLKPFKKMSLKQIMANLQ
ncbi:unnamed protein product [Moneuplotes crassus]|uniref:Uncharacterized protein n=1 Tax=Euplotes crassus TaxID=5936 RepID=A0AAD1XFI5_EUPCR|nr:unnamed protein product [Moneuplotes crassus]